MRIGSNVITIKNAHCKFLKSVQISGATTKFSKTGGPGCVFPEFVWWWRNATRVGEIKSEQWTRSKKRGRQQDSGRVTEASSRRNAAPARVRADPVLTRPNS
jgi:hypothetical protein